MWGRGCDPTRPPESGDPACLGLAPELAVGAAPRSRLLGTPVLFVFLSLFTASLCPCRSPPLAASSTLEPDETGVTRKPRRSSCPNAPGIGVRAKLTLELYHVPDTEGQTHKYMI